MHEQNNIVSARPVFEADHVSWTVPDLGAAVKFYTEVFGAVELFSMGPIDAADLPHDEQGRDWMETHVNVAGARLKLAMLKLTRNLNLQLVQYDKPDDRSQRPLRNCDRGGHHLGLRVDDVMKTVEYLAAHGCTVMDVIEITEGPLAGKKNVYVTDPWGHQLEIVD
ncbi:VOC family protein [Sphingosinicella microcystinivorans]|uniref:VOC family protein n=1 Tax=Sphingosinicella microcystinivorans TaxID=335406 RepID=UPI0022F387EF|nr:VOC family protein [Sphingosinicella microcystinivorans]WBX84154.1 VOC family protein [Sphingosinicella microcystinivorans]